MLGAAREWLDGAELGGSADALEGDGGVGEVVDPGQIVVFDSCGEPAPGVPGALVVGEARRVFEGAEDVAEEVAL